MRDISKSRALVPLPPGGSKALIQCIIGEAKAPFAQSEGLPGIRKLVAAGGGNQGSTIGFCTTFPYREWRAEVATEDWRFDADFRHSVSPRCWRRHLSEIVASRLMVRGNLGSGTANLTLKDFN